VPSVTAPAPPPPPAPVLVQATPRYRDNPAPLYPNQARRRGLEGTVVLEVLVGPDGRVKDLKLAQASGHRLLDEAASDSVRSWAFEPGRRGDQPLEMWVRVPVRFELH
jgi:protein TonB